MNHGCGSFCGQELRVWAKLGPQNERLRLQIHSVASAGADSYFFASSGVISSAS